MQASYQWVNACANSPPMMCGKLVKWYSVWLSGIIRADFCPDFIAYL
jgi:hypothetical protein